MMLEIPAWGADELLIFRIGLAFATIMGLSTLTYFRPPADPPHPVGFARILPINWIAPVNRAAHWHQLAMFAMLLVVADIAVPWALSLAVFVMVAEVTFISSHGAVGHGHHLVTVSLLAQLLAALTWNAAERWGWSVSALLGPTQEATRAWWTIQAIAASYCTSGFTKIIRTRGAWPARSLGLLLDARSRLDTAAMMRADVSHDRTASTTLEFLLQRPLFAKLLFTGGLAIELLAPVGLLGAWPLLVVGLGLLALHEANNLLLGLPFRTWQILVLTFFVNVPQFWR